MSTEGIRAWTASSLPTSKDKRELSRRDGPAAPCLVQRLKQLISAIRFVRRNPAKLPARARTLRLVRGDVPFGHERVE